MSAHCDWCNKPVWGRPRVYVLLTVVCAQCLYNEPAWSAVLVRALAIEALEAQAIRESRARAFRMWSWHALVTRADPDTRHQILYGGLPLLEYFRPPTALVMLVDLDDSLSRGFLEVRKYIAKMKDQG